SYGGMVVTGVADRFPQRIRSLIYLDAFVPANGQSLADLAPPPAWEAQMSGAASQGGGIAIPPFPAEMMGVRAEHRDRVDRLCSPQPLATQVERLVLSGGVDNVPYKAYLYADGWNNFGGFAAHLPAYRAKGFHVEEIACGHDIMIDAPGELADFLVRVARLSQDRL
ncbi:MAG: alpha/beta fold hydrolase, partial [Candidatus Binataceae bacterium]